VDLLPDVVYCMSLKRLLRSLLIILFWLSALLPLPAGRALTLSNLQSPISSLPPQGRAFASPAGDATIWLTPGPQPELWLAAPGEAPRLLLRDELEHFSTPRWSPDGRRVAVLAVPTGTETAARVADAVPKTARWW